jgi:hypothetical protein
MTTSDQDKPAAAVADTGLPKIVVFKGVTRSGRSDAGTLSVRSVDGAPVRR